MVGRLVKIALNQRGHTPDVSPRGSQRECKPEDTSGIADFEVCRVDKVDVDVVVGAKGP